MPYTLASGVSACVADSRLVFLDLQADRYLMIEPRTEAILLDRARTSSDLDGCAELDRLCALGLLVPTADERPLDLCVAPPPERSLLEQPWRRPSWHVLAGAAGSVLAATATLHWRGLARAIQGIPDSGRTSEDDVDRTLWHAAAFAELRLAIRTLDRCLPLSLALVRRARPTDREVRLIIGVKLGPFGAHAWAQRGPLVLNDRLDAVRAFTPVLSA